MSAAVMPIRSTDCALASCGSPTTSAVASSHADFFGFSLRICSNPFSTWVTNSYAMVCNACARGRTATEANSRITSDDRACSGAFYAPSGIKLAFLAPDPALWSLIHAQPIFDASCCRGNGLRIVSWPAHDFSTRRDGRALRHLDG